MDDNNKIEHIVYGDVTKEEIHQQKCIREYNEVNEGYITTSNAKDVIIRTRERFETSLLKHKGPAVIPTILKNHPKRFEFVRARERQLSEKRCPRFPPPQLPVKFSFADDVCMNLLLNLNPTKLAGYVKHVKPATIIHLKQEICGEQAFVEMLSHQPYCYSDDLKRLFQSDHVDSNQKSWSPPVNPCSNIFEFVVDFSIILPEKRVSTVFVMCYDCGQYVETMLYGSTVKAAAKDICHNVALLDLSKEGDNDRSTVVRLPTRGCSIEGCSFVEGLMGVTLLTTVPRKPSVFVRTRLFFFLDKTQNISSIIHKSKGEECSYITEHMNKFKIH
uniref:Uncharacterized protein n=2 Tax=Graphocephala atropunctata TaxID=36148 RepID=A0A1B6L260_9HEMI